MLRKVSRALGGKKESVRVRIDVTITELANLPAQAKSCRIVWARDAKVQMTRLCTVQEGMMRPNLDLMYFALQTGCKFLKILIPLQGKRLGLKS